MKGFFNSLNNFQQRLITGLSGSALIILGICASQWGYLMIFGLIASLTLMEFYKLTGMDGHRPLKYWGSFVGLFIYFVTFFIEARYVKPNLLILVFPLAFTVFFIHLYTKTKKPFDNIAYTFLGIIYIGIPVALINYAVFIDGKYHYEIALGLVLMLWASDTGAYFAGKGFGKTQLFARISPKKTWEGSIGGALLCFVFSFIMATYYPEFGAWRWYVIGSIIIIAGTMGDLVESLFKRSILIKDSGTVLPGHGGFLDRFDGLFLSAPFITAFLWLF